MKESIMRNVLVFKRFVFSLRGVGFLELAAELNDLIMYRMGRDVFYVLRFIYMLCILHITYR